MKKMRRTRGFTLVEVLIALVLIGVIAAGLLTFFSTGYQNILGQRNQNALNFDIQEDFETRLAKIKKDGGSGNDVETFTYRIGKNGRSNSVSVKGTTLSYKDNKVKNIHLFAANKKEIPLDIPEDLVVSLKDTNRYYYYAGETGPAGQAGLKDNKQSTKAKIHTSSAWFLSESSINYNNSRIVPVGTLGSNVQDQGFGIVLPKMPDDFQQISSNEKPITITDEMRGRYLTFAARGINSFGRVGKYQEATQRIWVMGLPNRGMRPNLVLHTDADLALMRNSDNTISAIPADGVAHTNTVVANYAETKKNGVYGVVIPVINYKEPAINQTRQLIALNDSKIQFSNHDFNKGYTTSILIGNRQQTGSLLTYKLDNSLNWTVSLEANGKIAIETVDNTNANNGGRQYANVVLDYTKDNSIQVRASVTNKILKLEVFVNGALAHTHELFMERNGVTHDIRRSQIIFGGKTFINEFAVYNKKLTDSEINILAEYFSDKYRAK